MPEFKGCSSKSDTRLWFKHRKVQNSHISRLIDVPGFPLQMNDIDHSPDRSADPKNEEERVHFCKFSLTLAYFLLNERYFESARKMMILELLTPEIKYLRKPANDSTWKSETQTSPAISSEAAPIPPSRQTRSRHT